MQLFGHHIEVKHSPTPDFWARHRFGTLAYNYPDRWYDPVVRDATTIVSVSQTNGSMGVYLHPEEAWREDAFSYR